jgi:ABC-type sugar transport system substrate-binding protein
VTPRTRSVEQDATLPGGRVVTVRVGVPEDPYVSTSDLDTVAAEILADGTVLATVNTVLDADQESEALELAREIAAGLESGELAPTVEAIEPLANTPR